MDRIIAVDFDGTLCENKWPDIGEANYELIAYILGEQLKGSKIILWTCRAEERLEKALEWCEDKGLIFDAVNENLPEVIEAFGGDTRKIYADEYIDDQFTTRFKLPFVYPLPQKQMTRQQALELEQLCEKLLENALGKYVSLSSGDEQNELRISVGDKTYDRHVCNIFHMAIPEYSLSYTEYKGTYENLTDSLHTIANCIRGNERFFTDLLWSYENIDKLKEDTNQEK